MGRAVENSLHGNGDPANLGAFFGIAASQVLQAFGEVSRKVVGVIGFSIRSISTPP